MVDQDTINFLQENHPWFFPVFVFIFGACVGSFLNVCIYRIPAGKSVVRPASHNAQGDPIKWYDNIPILSWFILGGKDRRTGESFSFRYPVIETLTAVLFLLLFQSLPLEQALVGMLFFSILIVASFIDIDHMVLPDILTVGGTFVGLVVSLCLPQIHGHSTDLPFMISGMQSLVSSILGILIGSGIILWMIVVGEALLKKEVMGTGDIVLMGCIGAFCGWQGAVFSIFGGAVIGSVVGIPLLLLQRNSEVKVMVTGSTSDSGEQTIDDGDDANAEKSLRGSSIPFGPWLAAAAVVYYLFLRDFVEVYFANLSFLVG